MHCFLTSITHLAFYLPSQSDDEFVVVPTQSNDGEGRSAKRKSEDHRPLGEVKKKLKKKGDKDGLAASSNGGGSKREPLGGRKEKSSKQVKSKDKDAVEKSKSQTMESDVGAVGGEKKGDGEGNGEKGSGSALDAVAGKQKIMDKGKASDHDKEHSGKEGSKKKGGEPGKGKTNASSESKLISR